MYFKRLELYGFKSFAEKTELYFEPGITAIVGPNGCGKSNVADAIKWVLGEQSPRELRGSKMEDVIFNGTSLKEPVNFSEVSLTLSNEAKIFPIEYEEITVTRRLFRSGESEYLLNKLPVRLKDIQELFMGTGIGTSAYSLLEQGKIDLILSSKAEDRRFVFEEAAGITKFKSQKREALRKLEDTENNLLRVSDIIAEVSRQLSSIERQARKAERYQEIFNLLKDKELKFSKYLYLQLESQIAGLEKEKTAIGTQEGKRVLEFNEVDSRVKEKRNALESIEQDISNQQSNKIHLDTSLEKSQSKINLDKERIKELEDRIALLTKESSELAQRIDIDSKELNGRAIQFEDFSKSEESKKLSFKEKQELLNSLGRQLKEKGNLISSSKIHLMDVVQEMSRTKNELTKTKTENTAFLARLRRLEVEKEKTLAEKERFNDAFNQTQKNLDGKKANLEKLSGQIEEISGRTTQLSAELKQLTDKLYQLDTESKTLSSRIEFLEGMKARYEGYLPGVKSLMLAKKSGELNAAGAIDVLADIIEVERGYELALESALGKHAQAILVGDYNSLEVCLEYVKKFNLGEINFIVLAEIDKHSLSPHLPKRELVYLRNFVRTLSIYEVVVEYLLKDVLLVKDLDEALRLYKEKKDYSLRWVTPAGELVENSIVKTAPIALGEDSSIIGRERRLKELKEDLASLDKNKDNILNNKNSLSFNLDKFSQELVSLQENKHAGEVEIGSLMQEIGNLDKTLKKLTDELAILDLEINEVREEIETATSKIKENEEALNKLESIEVEINRLIEENNNFLVEKNGLRESTLIELTELETELKSFMERVSLFKERISSLENSLAEEKRMLTTRENERLQATEKIQGLREEIVSLEKENLSWIDQRQVVLQKLTDLTEKKSQLKLEIAEEEEKAGYVQREIETLRNKIHELEIKQQEVNFNKRDLVEKMNSSYKVNLEATELDLRVEEFNVETAKQEYDTLKEKLEAMGPVNLVAIEEHRQLQERHTFLLSQQADLNKAKESLHEAINKINRTTQELFIETFEKIEVNFKDIFRLLFGGGNAQLLLLEPADVLESGIEIIAQPPGKRLQNISLLSGGERALTAVALLFAIFKVKPSPFCILDEVDAPLDEANIDRFRMLMKEFAKSSQFIVITHNKKTITIADVMYGITMEESGVSKIVSVKFTDATESVKIKSETE